MVKIAFFIFLTIHSPVNTARMVDEVDDNIDISQPASLLHETDLPPDLEPKYHNIELAGEGTFGSVYKAITDVDTDHTDQQVAIKVMKGRANSADLRKQCQKIQVLHEVVKAAQGSGVHLMNCIESAAQYVVYEWAGEEGSKLLPTQSFDAARSLLKQVIMALHALSCGSGKTIVHHDLKWQNVAVQDGCLKLIDLDDWIYGQWGNRLKKTPYTPLFSPPEILTTKVRPKNYFCGLTASRANEQGGAGVVCPGAYSFDIYTAGMMAVQICGFEWVFFATFMQEEMSRMQELVQREVKRKSLQREVKRYAGEDPVYESIPMYGIARLKAYLLQGNKLRDLLSVQPDYIQEYAEIFKEETMCNSLASEGFKLTHGCNQEKFKMDDATLMSHAAFAKEKFVSCKAELTPDAIDTMESMLHSQPRLRPDPAKLLNSELFTGVATNCDDDNSEGSFEESERAMTEEDEEGGQDPSAIYQNVIDDLKDQIAASKEAVYSGNSMNEHIEEMNVGSIAAAANQDQSGSNHDVRGKESVPENQVDNVNEQPQVSELKCGGCVEPVPQMIKTRRGMVPKRNKMGNRLAWCYLDSFPKREPRGCKWMGKKEKGKFVLQCTCQSGEEVRGLPV